MIKAEPKTIVGSAFNFLIDKYAGRYCIQYRAKTA